MVAQQIAITMTPHDPRGAETSEVLQLSRPGGGVKYLAKMK
jgi:hypothetical protein